MTWNGDGNGAVDEASLVRLYMELTGASASQARSVFMHVCCREREDATVSVEASIKAWREEEPVGDWSVWRMEAANLWLKEPVVVPTQA